MKNDAPLRADRLEFGLSLAALMLAIAAKAARVFVEFTRRPR